MTPSRTNAARRRAVSPQGWPGRRSALQAALVCAFVATAADSRAAPPEPAHSSPMAVQLNQVGYMPGAAKWAAVPVADTGEPATRYQVLDADTRQVVMQGPLGAPQAWTAAGQRLALADFSALHRPGRYVLQVPGLPDSAAFQVGPKAHQPLTLAALKALYFNRASTPLLAEHAGPWARPAGHPDTQVLVHASAASPGRPAGTVIRSPRGWYDAGDYNKYVVNSGITLWTLLAAWEHLPAAFGAVPTGIPESGNRLPDILDEALWNLDWMLTMQDPADGGVYHKLTSLNFDGVVMPHQSTDTRYVVAKSTAAALNFAATMAMASRVLRPFADQRPAGEADRLLAAARAAWAWAQAHPQQPYRQPPDVRTGEYGDEQLQDEFAWAAAELYITTGEPVFWQAFLRHTDDGQAPMTVPGWQSVAGLGWMSLAHHSQRLPSAGDRQRVLRRVAAQATHLAGLWHASPHRLGTLDGDYYWGASSVFMNRAIVLLQGWRLGGPRAHLDAAQALLDHVLGRNAQASTWVTGVGARSPRHPHHRPSEADGVEAPVPGFLVGGPNAFREDAKDCKQAYPSTLPARAWLDDFCSYASNEVAINWNAALAYVSAGLQTLTPPPAAKPR